MSGLVLLVVMYRCPKEASLIFSWKRDPDEFFNSSFIPSWRETHLPSTPAREKKLKWSRAVGLSDSEKMELLNQIAVTPH